MGFGPPFTFGEPVIRLRPTTAPGRYNDDEADWSDPDELVIEGCAFDPGGSSEVLDDRDATDTRPTLYLPAGADVVASDRVLVRDGTYDVDGRPADWRNPFTGDRPGLVAKLREVVG